ncbi:MAG: aminomethyl-transferring glycine dehydrogenase subunit GcvPB [Gemmatimonadetes bacterium]|nr:aminomethyl-transferring glycine dehydrogenase subunit GcvPB [Gemmatimonadota bacterium]
MRDDEQVLIFERSRSGRRGTPMPPSDVPERPLGELLAPEQRRAAEPRLPEVPEHEVVRHYTALSLLNHHVDRGLYPLGSCTMKYNPKVNEEVARLPGFAGVHPFAPHHAAQGALRLQYELQEYLAEISGMDAVTLQPAAGAHGELSGVFLMRAYHKARGKLRSRILIPDSAHGTNPATVALAGYDSLTLRSNAEGLVDVDDLKAHLDDEVAGFMVTNPNTHGKFERRILEIADLVHGVGGLMYMDGANLNAIMGVTRPGDMGFDILHFNTHKSFSTPHGGGGPGSGPVGVKAQVAPFLPVPVVRKEGAEYRLDWDRPQSIGKMHGFWGNFGVHVRAYAYIRSLGNTGIRETAEAAVLNNAYLSARLVGKYGLPYGRGLHESVFSGSPLKRFGVRTLDVAKRLLDFGVHAPTIYFPLTVPEALMIEPTETETREELDRFADALLAIAREGETDAERLLAAPHTTPVGRLDEGRAARQPDVRYTWAPARAETAAAR